MKHLVCSLLVSLLLVPLVWSQTRAIQPLRIEATTAQDESISYIYEESHALIIGVSDYTNGWSKLAGVKEDVIEVQRALEDNGFEVQLLEDPDKQQLEATIEDFIFEKGADPENRLLIYYAGHGHTKTLGYGGEMGYLVPADAPLPKKGRDIAFQRSVMSMQRIEEVAKNTSAKHVLFMFDACFAGSVFLATRAAPSYIEVFTEEPVRQFITSGSADQEVPDNSIFRRAFVDALAGSADFDKDGYLTGSELGTYIQKRTAEDWKGELTPQYGKLQDPNLNKGDFVFKIGKSANQSSTASTVTANSDLAAQAWEVVKDSTNPKILEEFIRMFPSAPQRNLAKLKLMTLESSSPIESTENLENIEVLAGDAAIQQVLKNKDCIGCNLAGAYLWKAELQGANLSGVDLTGAYLRGANLVGVNFKNAKLNGADLKGANLQRASFCNTSMPDGSISNMGCEKTDQATPESETAFGLSGEAAKKQLLKKN
ncbi:MAG: pentapeptide repeat-containing protein, partial [SAR324 cluster bacterium]|nr:pentapeptide repeat-containing protein [SAR324 cluster bacterium]